MSAITTVVMSAAGAYLIGSIPVGFLVGRLRGIDVRSAGSRNIGATNVGRLLGRKYGILVFLLDVLKGLGPTAAAGWVLIGLDVEGQGAEPARYLCWLAVGAACVLGHNYPLYLRLRGGKGVATSLGVTLGVYPDLTYPGLAAFGIWAVVVAISRYVSLGSIAAGIAFPALFALMAHYRGRALLAECWPLLAFSVSLGLLVVLRHRGNIGRLLAGTEAKMGRRVQRANPTDTAQPGRGEEPIR